MIVCLILHSDCFFVFIHTLVSALNHDPVLFCVIKINVLNWGITKNHGDINNYDVAIRSRHFCLLLFVT